MSVGSTGVMTENDSTPPDNQSTTFTTDASSAAVVALSAADVASAVAKAKAETEAAFAESLGMSAGEAKKKLDALNAAEEAAMTEIQRKEKLATETLAAAEAAKSAAEARVHEVNVTAALKAAGAPGKAAAMLDVPLGADDDVINAAVAELKKEMPGLFAASGVSGKTNSDNPRPPVNTGGGVTSASDRARKMFEQRNPRLVKST